MATLTLEPEPAAHCGRKAGFPRSYDWPRSVSGERGNSSATVFDKDLFPPFTAAWTQEFEMKLRQDWDATGLFEYVCEENNRCAGGNCKRQSTPSYLATMCPTSWLFSVQMYSPISSPTKRLEALLMVHSFTYVPGSSIVISYSR
jgi:hypothetical protein